MLWSGRGTSLDCMLRTGLHNQHGNASVTYISGLPWLRRAEYNVRRTALLCTDRAHRLNRAGTGSPVSIHRTACLARLVDRLVVFLCPQQQTRAPSPDRERGAAERGQNPRGAEKVTGPLCALTMAKSLNAIDQSDSEGRLPSCYEAHTKSNRTTDVLPGTPPSLL